MTAGANPPRPRDLLAAWRAGWRPPRDWSAQIIVPPQCFPANRVEHRAAERRSLN